MYPNEVNMIVVPNNKKKGDYFEYPSLSNFTSEHQLQGKWWSKKLFLPNQSINIMYPNEMNMIVVPNNKSNGDYYDNPSLSHFTNEL